VHPTGTPRRPDEVAPRSCGHAGIRSGASAKRRARGRSGRLAAASASGQRDSLRPLSSVEFGRDLTQPRAPTLKVATLLLRVRLRVSASVASVRASPEVDDHPRRARDELRTALDALALARRLATFGVLRIDVPGVPLAPRLRARRLKSRIARSFSQTKNRSAGPTTKVTARRRASRGGRTRPSERWQAELVACRLPQASTNTPE
jgi:hypothetical protein